MKNVSIGFNATGVWLKASNMNPETNTVSPGRYSTLSVERCKSSLLVEISIDSSFYTACSESLLANWLYVEFYELDNIVVD